MRQTALHGHRGDALAIRRQIEDPAASAPILTEATPEDRRDPHGVVLVRTHGHALRAFRNNRPSPAPLQATGALREPLDRDEQAEAEGWSTPTTSAGPRLSATA
jgi:hypothetical protein